ncbi:MAG: c-type cytochrome, partial [Verrucomicrobiota bacterium]
GLVAHPDPAIAVQALWTLQQREELSPATLISSIQSRIPELAENGIILATTRPDRGEFVDAVSIAASQHSGRVRTLGLLHYPETSPAPAEAAAWITDSEEDPWLTRAFLSNPNFSALPTLISYVAAADSPDLATVEELARVGASMIYDEALVESLSLLSGEAQAWHFSFLRGIDRGLGERGIGKTRLGPWLESASQETAAPLEIALTRVEEAAHLVDNRTSGIELRLAAFPLVASLPLEQRLRLIRRLLVPAEAPEIQREAVRLLSQVSRTQQRDFLFANWQQLPPSAAREAIALLVRNTENGLALMKQMAAGQIDPGMMPAMTRWSYSRSSNAEVQALAKSLFGQVASDRAEVISHYRAQISGLSGDPARGRDIYAAAACASCHIKSGLGYAVGPALDDLSSKPREAILTDILDPNRAVEDRWSLTTLVTHDGQNLSGLIDHETESQIVLKVPGGVSLSVARQDLSSLSSSTRSLMPVGLEAAIPPQEMADLIAFLKNR